MTMVGEYFHIFNRGVDKRSIFEDVHDLQRFLTSMQVFNTDMPVGGVYVASLQKNSKSDTQKNKIVSIVAYCLNKNHFHFIIKPLVEKGGSLFMQRLCAGYTKYYNEKYDRSGALFQGKHKKVIIETNEQLLHTSAYVSANNRVHPGLNPVCFSKAPFSSWEEYTVKKPKYSFCDKEIVLEQFSSTKAYADFVTASLVSILDQKKLQKELKNPHPLHLE